MKTVEDKINERIKFIDNSSKESINELKCLLNESEEIILKYKSLIEMKTIIEELLSKQTARIYLYKLLTENEKV